ncbi:MAG: hypothetical protein JWQ81_8552 [Amycolatopsis sp.]|jgi:hypothetical protein|uniref:hypothetical protein n=1 Tax=Amycolatopsis sp. TaxID=37632 RepID=UPI002617ECB0|nr:hypothetical protein [Amycolatopsis sp.]MCU1687813.1 hypothetical protein [Amycolatopsis sp.]
MTTTIQPATEHEPDTWQPIDTAPEDGTVILGRYDEGEAEIRWATHRAALGGLSRTALGAGWVSTDDGFYIDPPQCWQPVVTLHVRRDDCQCEPLIGDAGTRWHRGAPATRVFVPVDGDDIDADGFPSRDHR